MDEKIKFIADQVLTFVLELRYDEIQQLYDVTVVWCDSGMMWQFYSVDVCYDFLERALSYFTHVCLCW